MSKALLEVADAVGSAAQWIVSQEFIRSLWLPMADPMWLRGYKESQIEADLKATQDKANEKFFPKK